MLLAEEHIAGSYTDARRYTRHHAKSFYFASHVLPKEKRNMAYAVYAFCRYADNVVDGTSSRSVEAKRRDIESLRAMLDDIYNHGASSQAQFLVFKETVVRCGIPQEYFLDLLQGMEMDMEPVRCGTFGDLHSYCYYVAGVVGLIMSRVFGVKHTQADTHAKDLGTAMQLTNILRDVKEDLQRDRVYLPQDEMTRYGLSVDDLTMSTVDTRFRDFMKFQIRRARQYYKSGEAGFRYIPDDGSRYCAKLMSGIYSNILTEIEKQGFNVFGRRAAVSGTKKVIIAFSALKKETDRSL